MPLRDWGTSSLPARTWGRNIEAVYWLDAARMAIRRHPLENYSEIMVSYRDG